jgi:hypothetical protein
MRYEDVAHLLPGIVDGTAHVDDATLAFVESDLRSQAELARYRRLLRGLADLRGSVIEPHPAALTATLDALDVVPGRRLLRRLSERKRLAGAALGTAVVTAGAAAVIVARSRRRVAVLAA